MDDKLSDDAKSAAHAVKSKVNEGADRARAAGHDAAAETRDNPIDRVSDKAQAGVDRAKAGVNEAKADLHAEDAKR
jgi:hypothetical protein